MKNYINYIKESNEQDIVIDQCLKTETFRPLLAFRKNYVEKYLNWKWYNLAPYMKKFLEFAENNNMYLYDQKTILEVCIFMDDVFKNLTLKKSNDYNKVYNYNSRKILGVNINEDVILGPNTIVDIYYSIYVFDELKKFISEHVIIDIVVKSYIKKYLNLESEVCVSTRF